MATLAKDQLIVWVLALVGGVVFSSCDGFFEYQGDAVVYYGSEESAMTTMPESETQLFKAVEAVPVEISAAVTKDQAIRQYQVGHFRVNDLLSEVAAQSAFSLKIFDQGVRFEVIGVDQDARHISIFSHVKGVPYSSGTFLVNRETGNFLGNAVVPLGRDGALKSIKITSQRVDGELFQIIQEWEESFECHAEKSDYAEKMRGTDPYYGDVTAKVDVSDHSVATIRIGEPSDFSDGSSGGVENDLNQIFRSVVPEEYEINGLDLPIGPDLPIELAPQYEISILPIVTEQVFDDIYGRDVNDVNDMVTQHLNDLNGAFRDDPVLKPLVWAKNALSDSGAGFLFLVIDRKLEEEVDTEKPSEYLDVLKDAVEPYRDKYKADLVTLFVSSGGGAAWPLKGSDAAKTGEWGYSYINYAATTGFPHEIGHNLGGCHDFWTEGGGCDHGWSETALAWTRVTDSDRDGSYDKGLRTLMAYIDLCEMYGVSQSACPTIYRYSNKEEIVNGWRIGSEIEDQVDNFIESIPVVAGYR